VLGPRRIGGAQPLEADRKQVGLLQQVLLVEPDRV